MEFSRFLKNGLEGIILSMGIRFFARAPRVKNDRSCGEFPNGVSKYHSVFIMMNSLSFLESFRDF